MTTGGEMHYEEKTPYLDAIKDAIRPGLTVRINPSNNSYLIMDGTVCEVTVFHDYDQSWSVRDMVTGEVSDNLGFVDRVVAVLPPRICRGAP